MKKTIFTLLVLVFTIFNSAAQNAAYNVLSECDTTLMAKLQGLALGSREVRFIAYEYPSTDAKGQAVTVSGAIIIPSDVLNDSVPCDGVIMYNHLTIDSPDWAPSLGGAGIDDIGMGLASPLKPNYIVVASDYIGYGSSINSDVSYICGDTNSRNSLDGLLAARQLLADRQIQQGKYLFNVGYSQGGTVSMFAAKLTDMEEKYKGIRFDKTFSGGGPLDFEKIYTIYVQQDACADLANVALMLISANENYDLGIDYKDMFQEPLASKAKEFFKSKRKRMFSEIGISSLDSISQILTPEFMNLESEAAMKFISKMKEISLTEGWEPDTTKLYYIEHSRHDDYVPIQSARGIIPWMREKGFDPSIVPGKSSLQTNTAVFKLNHEQSSIVWTIQTMAAIQFWPVVYYEGEQNRYYRDVVSDMNLMKVIRMLASWGIDIKEIVGGSISLGRAVKEPAVDGKSRMNLPERMTLFDLIPNINETLAKVGLTTDDIDEMCEDAGITIYDLAEVLQYLVDPEYTSRAAKMEERVEAPLYLLRRYEQTLTKWYLLGGFDVNYSLWGM